jgi:4-hydroxyacetophenone monooxygenase
VLATGFESSKMLSPNRLPLGRAVEHVWGEDNPYAYLDMTVPDFPNFFIVGGRTPHRLRGAEST